MNLKKVIALPQPIDMTQMMQQFVAQAQALLALLEKDALGSDQALMSIQPKLAGMFQTLIQTGTVSMTADDDTRRNLFTRIQAFFEMMAGLDPDALIIIHTPYPASPFSQESTSASDHPTVRLRHHLFKQPLNCQIINFYSKPHSDSKKQVQFDQRVQKSEGQLIAKQVPDSVFDHPDHIGATILFNFMGIPVRLSVCQPQIGAKGAGKSTISLQPLHPEDPSLKWLMPHLEAISPPSAAPKPS